MRKSTLALFAGILVCAIALGCKGAEPANEPVAEKPAGSAKTPAKGMDPNSLELPAGSDGKGSFGTKAGGGN
jgi:hypothetical protein